MLNARVHGYLNDEGTQTIGGTITAIGGRYDDIKAIRWDDGTTSHVAEHHRGVDWDYDDEDCYADCPQCGEPLSSTAWIASEHRPDCPRHDPHF